ncbi:anaerobic ribonucleoside-triphosphate reductase-activating protein [Coraliomargarita parva]|uniref:anaerobic ribonucleoside-triphosphate reductase-activating protein n=1 Tax=Coraliomargarita parva TaxID=3014050 RepID=UPI0022B3E29F|nr:anaerobic ribonucleoside-triphosphate reductase-activating protein [Coraliomargarita parva]
MNYHRYIDLDVVNGPGNRCTLFVAGCEHHCPGCYNASTWSPDSGRLFDKKLVERIVSDLNDSRIPRNGLSLSGGDPLYPGNCAAVLELARTVKARCPGKNIWLWSGYLLENLNPAQQAILEYIDVLIDGPFVQNLANPSLRFRGSSNQRILERSRGHFQISQKAV